MPDEILNSISHRRYNPLRGTWILVSPHRTNRPWQGQQEEPSKTDLPHYDPSCFLCPGNQRAHGEVNPQYDSTFVFVNDYSAVKAEQPAYVSTIHNDGLDSQLLRAEGVRGRCYVLTFSPAHNSTLADLEPRQIETIIDAWTLIYAQHVDPLTAHGRVARSVLWQLDNGLLQLPRPPAEQFTYMQIFENKGAAMGCSNPHPHGQIWCTSGMPEEPRAELEHLTRYRDEHAGAHMLVDYVSLESRRKERLVCESEGFVAVCPWWATWPFEVMIASRLHRRSLVDLDARERADLAAVISDVTRRYDNLFQTQFPYSMGLHQAPLHASVEEIEASHLHIHFYPPLLRSATVRKFLVGYEMMAEPQRDITPEQAAARLRACGGPLYRSKTL